MKRRINWSKGDSAPLSGFVSIEIADIGDGDGDGIVAVTTGFPVSSVQVSFSESYNRFLKNEYTGGGSDKYAFPPTVSVQSVNATGFVLVYSNIPKSTLEVNYFIM